MSVKSFLRQTWLLISFLRLIPHIIFMKCHPSRDCIKLDIERWVSCLNMEKKPDTTLGTIWFFIQLMTFHPEYRSLFYYRMGWIGKMLYLLCRPMPTLYIYTKNIGPGLFIQHGFATIISAEKIGRNCWINQQVTIGFSNDTDTPSLGDNVTIYAGAKVFGNISVGDNSIVGANAVVLKDVPENCVVAGIPAYIIRRNGVSVKEPL